MWWYYPICDPGIQWRFYRPMPSPQCAVLGTWRAKEDLGSVGSGWPAASENTSEFMERPPELATDSGRCRRIGISDVNQLWRNAVMIRWSSSYIDHSRSLEFLWLVQMNVCTRLYTEREQCTYVSYVAHESTQFARIKLWMNNWYRARGGTAWLSLLII